MCKTYYASVQQAIVYSRMYITCNMGWRSGQVHSHAHFRSINPTSVVSQSNLKLV